MASYKDVVVDIQRLTARLRSDGLWLPLILTTQSDNEYKEYSGIDAVALDFGTDTTAYGMAAAMFSQDPAPQKVAIVGIMNYGDMTAVTDGLSLVYGAHYFTFLVSDIVEQNGREALANWATAFKVFYTSVISVAELTTISNPNSDYVMYCVHDKKATFEEHMDAAIVGKCIMFAPGSATWNFKNLNGISPQEFIDQATMVDMINEKGYVTYITTMGRNRTTGGYVTSGEYMDIMLGVLWIRTTMEQRIQSLLFNTPKIPYTDEGIALIASRIDSTLRDATEMDIIRETAGGIGEYTINIPTVAGIDPNNIANRKLVDLTWDAYLAGAVHHVNINGVVHY